MAVPVKVYLRSSGVVQCDLGRGIEPYGNCSEAVVIPVDKNDTYPENDRISLYVAGKPFFTDIYPHQIYNQAGEQIGDLAAVLAYLDYLGIGSPPITRAEFDALVARVVALEQGGGTNLPVITTQPTAQSITVGATLALNVVATGTGLSYQWYKDGAVISGATLATFSKPNSQTTDSGNYKVRVSNSAGYVDSASVGVNVQSGSAAIYQLNTNTPLNSNTLLYA